MGKYESSIKLIKLAAKGGFLNLAFSGGKDSVVLYDLAMRADVVFKAHYINSGIDLPGLIGFIRKHYPHVEIIQPERKFFDLVADKGLPTRRFRYCCFHLREYYGIGRTTMIGVRKSESPRRKLYEPITCDKRSVMKGAKYVMPLLEWSEYDIWNYIHAYNLPYSKYYEFPFNFRRVGCVGCPLAGAKKQLFEFVLFPKYAKAVVRAIGNNMVSKPNNSLARYFVNEYQAFFWYISGMRIMDFIMEDHSALAWKEKFYNTFYPYDCL